MLTLAVTVARKILEDVGALPFANLVNLSGFDTTNPATLPANDPELAIARRWRYMLAGAGGGFTFTTAGQAPWGTLTPFAGRATIQIGATRTTLRPGTGEIGRAHGWTPVTVKNRMPSSALKKKN